MGAAVLACCATALAAELPVAREALGSLSDWVAGASEQVQAQLRPVDGPHGPGMCLDFDFGGAAGYATVRRALALTLPPDFEFDLELSGEAAGHDFQLKLLDATGENIWWYRRAEFDFPRTWQPLRIRKWQIKFAGDSKLDRPLRKAAAIELAVAKGTGGARGSVCVDRFDLLERAVADHPPPPRVTGSSPGATAASTLDAEGRLQPPWSSDPAQGPRQWVQIDLGWRRDFGGIVLQWTRDEYPSRYDVQLSDNGNDWRTVREVVRAGGPEQVVPLPDAEARYLRLGQVAGAARTVRLIGLQIQDPQFGSDPNRVVELLAARSPRGRYPRSFCGEHGEVEACARGASVAGRSADAVPERPGRCAPDPRSRLGWRRRHGGRGAGAACDASPGGVRRLDVRCRLDRGSARGTQRVEDGNEGPVAARSGGTGLGRAAVRSGRGARWRADGRHRGLKRPRACAAGAAVECVGLVDAAAAGGRGELASGARARIAHAAAGGTADRRHLAQRAGPDPGLARRGAAAAGNPFLRAILDPRWRDDGRGTASDGPWPRGSRLRALVRAAAVSGRQGSVLRGPSWPGSDPGKRQQRRVHLRGGRAVPLYERSRRTARAVAARRRRGALPGDLAPERADRCGPG